MANQLSKSGIVTGADILAKHVTQSVDAFTGIDEYDITISGSLTVTGSLNLNSLDSSSQANVLTYNKQTGKVHYTSSNTVGGGGTAVTASLLKTSSISGNTLTFEKGDSSTYDLIINTGSIEYLNDSASIQSIQVLNFDPDVAVNFSNGNLQFIFGNPTAPTLDVALSGFLVDRFNQVEDNYNVVGTWNVGAYSLISASLFEGSTLLANAGVGSSLFDPQFTSGSHTYRIELTSSNPIDGSISQQSDTVTGTIIKSQPINPLITSTADVFLGTNGGIEVGSTGSITYTGSVSSTTSNAWTFQVSQISNSYPYAPLANGFLTISGSFLIENYTEDQAFSFRCESDYSSLNLNLPVLTTTTNSSTENYNRIRSLRFGAFIEAHTGSLESNLYNLGDFLKSGSIYKGTSNPNNQNVSLTQTNGEYQYIIYSATEDPLTVVEAGGQNFISTFVHSNSPQTIDGYRVYKSSTGLGAATVSYLLKTT